MKRNKKDKTPKVIKKFNNMSDEEFLNEYKKIKKQSLFMSFGGLLIIVLCVVAFIVFFGAYGGYK